jgi:hypothetical protein
VAKAQTDARKDRLAAALRANLKRRKARDRALARSDEASPANPPERQKSDEKPR